ncbi:hypothetical protein H310_05099 [Aphanomyces invadans]|uniref:Uncharacterized protein n=1 Tax=Aphanomyces invadans TaxID=157072 RepID=A0A024UBY4_9STRA|nr:hypothetical protein H310_05099 [Aphanomyces invadans]ETW03720.1 hypothetical protein H310_05099 [Aphanomyces invadans]|eukprot:XP_008867949.1 hypothetical protein H310_05099 [Aphanomyces invadans]
MPRGRQTRRKVFTVTEKLEVVKRYLNEGESFYSLGKSCGAQGNQVCRWVANHELLKQAAQRSPQAATVSIGRPVTNLDVEEQVLEYYNVLRDDDVAISTKMLKLKALNIDPTFRGGYTSALTSWHPSSDSSWPEDVVGT